MAAAPQNLPSCIYGVQLKLKPSWEAEGVLRKGIVLAFDFLSSSIGSLSLCTRDPKAF